MTCYVHVTNYSRAGAGIVFANCVPTKVHSVYWQRAIFIQVKVNISSGWLISQLICKTWSFCVPMEIAWRAKCVTRAVGCRPLFRAPIANRRKYATNRDNEAKTCVEQGNDQCSLLFSLRAWSYLNVLKSRW